MGGLSGFKERKSHVLPAGIGAGANYQMRIHVYYGAGADIDEDMYCNSKCNADFSDLRFTSNDEQTLLSYWLESKLDGDNAIFWVKVIEDLDSDRTIYVYYGNSYAASLSNQANTFIDVISGVVGAWNMEEALATDPVVDYSGSSLNGAATDTTVTTGRFISKNSRSFALATSNIHIDNPNIVSATGALSINIKATIYNAETCIFNYFKDWNDFFYIYANNAGQIVVVFQKDGVPDSIIFVANLVADAWYNLILVQDGTGLSLYKNGNLIRTDPSTKWFVNCDLVAASDIDVGAFQGFSAFSGLMGNLNIYSGNINSSTANLSVNYPDVSLEAGKVLVRKYATTALPTHGDWGTELDLPCYCSRHARRRRLKRGR
jgi:hypothetical protein